MAGWRSADSPIGETRLVKPGARSAIRVSEPADPAERQAEDMAERTVDSPNRPTAGFGLLPLSAPAAEHPSTPQIANIGPGIAGPGAPLDPSLRREMELRFGHDFSGVRIHSDSTATEQARAFGARAYTAGQDIVVAGGGSSVGLGSKHLIAHELGHVVQQSRGQERAVVQRQVDADARDPWASLTPAGRKDAQALYDDCMWWIGQLVAAQSAHPSGLRSAWLKFLSENLLSRIGGLEHDSRIAPLGNVLTDVTSGYMRTVAQAEQEWLAVEQRYREERQGLLSHDPSTDAIEAVSDLDEKYQEAKRWLTRGASDYITEDDYLVLKDTLQTGKHITLGVLRGSRKRAEKLDELLRTVAELRHDGEDADKFVPGWQERVDFEANHLDLLSTTIQATAGYDYPAEFRRMRVELLNRKAEALRAHKPTKNVAEKAVDFVVGGAESLVGPFIEAAREAEDLTKIAMHFATLGKYEPKFTSDMAEAARQGQGTGDLLKGMAKGLIQTPERFVNAVESGDWEAIGRETVNLYMLAKTIKETPELVEKVPGLLAKTRRGLRLLKARKLAVELNESRLLPGTAANAIPAPAPSPAPRPSVAPSEPTMLGPRPSPKVTGFRRDPQPVAPSASAPSAPIDTQLPPARRLPTTADPREPKAMADEPKRVAEPKPTVEHGRVEPANEAQGSPASTGETVPKRKLREELRERLEQRAREKKAMVDELAQDKNAIDRRVRAINDKIETTSDAAEVRRLQDERRQLLDERLDSRVSKQVADEWLEAKRLLKATEFDYFEALSSSASKRRGYQNVRARGRDEVFGTKGRGLEVEHVYPRSKIFSTPGFERLTWDQQVAVFNYEPNLKLIPADINLARSATPYASWKGASRFPEITPRAIADLAALEAKMEKDIGAMIRKPSLIPLARE